MDHASENRRLSSLDAFFLYHERRENPFNIGGVSLFDGELDPEEMRRTIAGRLSRGPRYRQRLVGDPLNLGHPVWRDDPNFDLHHHVQSINLNGTGTGAELGRLAGEIMSRPLDRSKPLWDLTIVNGLTGGQTAWIPRFHHCLVDGVGGVELMKILLDASPADGARGETTPELPPGAREMASHGWSRRLFDAALGGLEEIMERAVDLNDGLLGLARQLLDNESRQAAGRLGAGLPDLARPVDPLPFNRTLSGERHFDWLDFPLVAAQSIRTNLHGSLNDVLLTVLGLAVSSYLRETGHPVAGRSTRVLVPVNVRAQPRVGSSERRLPGNQISFLPVVLPLDKEDPVALFRQINAQTRLMKQGRLAELVNLLISGYGTIPAPLQAVAGTALPPHLPPFNLISTNVPGPAIPLYAQGRRLIAHYPYVPIAYTIGFGLATLSYDQRLCLGLTSDRQAFPDGGRMRELLPAAFARLQLAANSEVV